MSTVPVFEDDNLKDKTVAAVEKTIHFGDSGDSKPEDMPAAQTKEVA